MPGPEQLPPPEQVENQILDQIRHFSADRMYRGAVEGQLQHIVDEIHDYALTSFKNGDGKFHQLFINLSNDLHDDDIWPNLRLFGGIIDPIEAELVFEEAKDPNADNTILRGPGPKELERINEMTKELLPLAVDGERFELWNSSYGFSSDTSR